MPCIQIDLILPCHLCSHRQSPVKVPFKADCKTCSKNETSTAVTAPLQNALLGRIDSTLTLSLAANRTGQTGPHPSMPLASPPTTPCDFVRLSHHKSERRIRVLCLTAHSGELQVVSLDARPKFAALSYVRGDYASPRDKIMCNGFGIEVTRDCMAAVVQLCKSLGPIVIWIDPPNASTRQTQPRKAFN